MNGIKYVSMDGGGYGVAAERAITALAASGVPVTWTPMVPGKAWGPGRAPSPRRDLGPPALRPLCNRPLDYDTVVVHTVPEYFPHWRRAEPGRRLIGHTVWETNRLPPAWPELCRSVDALVVPCRWNAEVFALHGVQPAPQVVPHICDPEPLPQEPRDDGEFRFYTIGVWSTRKGIEETVTAFCRAFTRRDRVRLILKTTPGVLSKLLWPWSMRGRAGRLLRRFFGAGHWPARWTLARLRRAYPDAPAVDLVTAALTHAGMRRLHARCDAYVSLCRGEGWGLGAFDAATYGRPVIMTGHGGQRDYLDPSLTGLIDYDLEGCEVPDLDSQASYLSCQQWARPRIAHAVELMQAVRADPAAARRRAAILAERVRTKFAPPVVAASWRRVLEGRTPDKE